MDEDLAELPVEDEVEIEAAEAEPIESESDDDEIIVTIGEDAAPASESENDPDFMKVLRKKAREADQLRKELAAIKAQSAEKPKELGLKPTLVDFDYDEGAFETALDEWKEEEANHKAHQAKAEEARQKANEAWQGEIAAFESQKQSFAKVKGWEDAEAIFVEAFTPEQQAVLINAAPDKALLVYALGSNKEARERLSKLTDLSKFTFEAGQFAGTVKMERRKPLTAPETAVTPSAPLAAGADRKEAALEAKARASGDYTELFAYRRSKAA